MMTIQQAFHLAVQHHQAGRLAEAEALYRQILAVQPNYADALHHLGIIAHQVGRHDVAVQTIRQAIALYPHNPAAHSNLGESYRLLGRLDEAIASFRRALELQPDYPAAHYNLGNALQQRGLSEEAVAASRRALELKPDYPEAYNSLANALMDRGQLDEAIAAYRRLLELLPDCAPAHSNLGNALRERGQLDEAVSACRRALELKPDFAEAHNNLGLAIKERGQLDEAIAAFHQGLALKPDFAGAHNNLGSVFNEQGQIDEAIAAFQRAIELNPSNAEAHNNLGNAFRERGQLEAAIAAYRRALELKPGLAGTYNNLGNVFRDQGQPDDAMAAYCRAIELQPTYAEAHSNLGNMLKDRDQLDEAATAIRRALELKPGLAGAHSNLGNVLRDQGRLDEAIAAYRHTLQLAPERLDLHSNLIYSLHFDPRQNDTMIAEEQRRWNRQFGKTLHRPMAPYANDRNPERRLRIGYVSPDFRDHVVGRNLLPLLKRHHDRDYEVACYSGAVRTDGLTEEIHRRTAVWRDTTGIADEALAEMIRQDGVDILVDLTQHMAGNRLPVFARQPAPVQVSFAGYPASTGLDTIRYRISDRYLEKEKRESQNGEQVFLLDSFWCYDTCGIEMAVPALPAKETGWVTFGSLNSFCKINDAVLKLWARVLKAVKDSRLIVLSGFGSHRQQTLELLEREGIEAGRVEFVGRRLHRDYLEFYHRLDIALDTFPYNGHTTSLDALWMGVPVMSLAGERAVSRAGLSQLSNLGLPELVAHSEDEYFEIATRLAHDLPRLAELRRTLRPRMEASVLMDAPRFAHSIEAAYRSMWHQWCAEKTEL